MKYDPETTETENRHRWLNHAQHRGQLCPFHELPIDLRTAAWKMAETLADLEVRIYREVVPILTDFGFRKATPKDRLEDFDITLTLTYRLRQSDPEWEAFDENILYVQSFSLYESIDMSIPTGFGKPHGASPWQDWPGEAVCWTFLDLLESGISWEDIARIHSIGSSLTVKTDESPVPV